MNEDKQRLKYEEQIAHRKRREAAHEKMVKEVGRPMPKWLTDGEEKFRAMRERLQK